MAYRRKSDVSNSSKNWRSFVLSKADLFRAVGVPLYLQDDEDRFDHWLMHGHHPDDHSNFSSRSLDQEARAALVKLVDAYFEAGFEDPGIVVLTDSELMTLSKPPPIVGYLQSSSPEFNLRRKRSKR